MSGISLESENINYKLESIFMPLARMQRDNFFSVPNSPQRFVHYTSAESALKIIKTKKFWMRNTNCMSDFREVQHGLDILNQFFGVSEKKEQLLNALEKCAPGAAHEAIEKFTQCWGNIEHSTYITSILEHDVQEDTHGRLSMWRAFGGQPSRVALVLNIPWQSTGAWALNLLFSPVSYLSQQEAFNNIEQVTKNIEENCEFLQHQNFDVITMQVFNLLLESVTCFKHEGFREEREWRAIYCPEIFPSNLMESSIEVVSGVPQVIYKIPLDESHSSELADLEFSKLFDRLIIGPTQYPSSMFDAFYTTLQNAGVENPQIKISGIPIRT